MAQQYSVSARNAWLDSIIVTVGASPLLRIYTGTPPADCASAATGTKLVEATLPVTWLGAASGGTVSKSGTWEDSSANATGVAGYYRIYDSGDTACFIQGTVSATSGGGDMELNNTSINSTQDVIITAFSIAAGNA